MEQLLRRYVGPHSAIVMEVTSRVGRVLNATQRDIGGPLHQTHN